MDPMGAEVETSDPYLNFSEPTYSDLRINEPLYLEGGDPFDYSSGYEVDGMPVSESQLRHMLDTGSVVAGLLVRGQMVGFWNFTGNGNWGLLSGGYWLPRSGSTGSTVREVGFDETNEAGDVAPGGETSNVPFDWRSLSVSFHSISFSRVGPQNPPNSRVPLTKREIYEARRNIRDLLQNPICNNFIKGMLEEFGKLPQGVFSLDLVKIFDAVRAQSNGGLFRDVTQSGSFAYAFGSLELGNATIAYRNSLDGGDGAHETMHVAARTGYGFSHQQMAQAAMSSAQAMGIMVAGILPNPNDYATTKAWDSANSQFFDRIFFQACVKGWIR
jgi:hypothetical protein